jgi:hypothetical protein
LICRANNFNFDLPQRVRWARRILIKPCAGYPLPYPISTSRDLLAKVVSAIRKVSEADIILLEGSSCDQQMKPIYRSLGYDFPRVLALDVKESVFVEVENPLARPFAMSTFWLPNVLLYCDYLITMAPFKVFSRQGNFCIRNLLSLLPAVKYQGQDGSEWGALRALGLDKVIADLYFTLPFDLGVVDGRQKFIGTGEPAEGESEPLGKIFVGEPYEVDWEASQAVGLVTEYLQWIEIAKAQMEGEETEQAYP